MITFKTNKDNKDYLDINRLDLAALAADNSIPENAKQVAMDIYSSIYDYEKDLGFISDVTILKNSALGKYLLSANEEIINEDFVISYKKVVDAFNTAIYTGEAARNKTIGFNLHQMFLNKTHGSYYMLSTNHSLEVLDYIVDNGDFEDLIKKEDEDYEPEEYIIYENGYLTKESLYEKEKVKVKTKEK